MPGAHGFQWQEGQGWIVLAGATEPYSEAQADIRARLIGLASADGALACIDLSGDLIAADRLLDDLGDLGAPAGYIVDLASDDDETLHERLSDASIIVLAGEPEGQNAYSALVGAAIEGIAAAHRNGAAILAETGAAAALGLQIFAPEEARVNPGFGWFSNAAIMALNATETDFTRMTLAGTPGLNAIGLGENSAIVFGPDGEIETWGARQIKVVLGAVR